jgi:hypothetical protein
MDAAKGAAERAKNDLSLAKLKIRVEKKRKKPDAKKLSLLEDEVKGKTELVRTTSIALAELESAEALHAWQNSSEEESKAQAERAYVNARKRKSHWSLRSQRLVMLAKQYRSRVSQSHCVGIFFSSSI